MLTILTATYNRADKLKTLYASLLEQTAFDFEWIIADDGSEDNTDEVARGFDGGGKFAVRYLKLPHGGKHRAVNAGAKSANGDYIAVMDSDDYFLPHGIELIQKRLDEVRDIESIGGIMMSQYIIKDGVKTINSSFPKSKDYVDLYNYERNNKQYRGDRLEVPRRDLLLKYPFPEFEGEYFVTESAVWNRISAEGYKFRIYKEAVCVIEYLSTGLTNSYSKLRLNNYRGYAYAIKSLCDICPVRKCFWVVRNYAKLSAKKGVPASAAAKAIGIKPYIIKFMRLF